MIDGIVKQEQNGKIYTLWVLDIKEFEMESVEYIWSENKPTEERIIYYMHLNGYGRDDVRDMINNKSYDIYPVYAERVEQYVQ